MFVFQFLSKFINTRNEKKSQMPWYGDTLKTKMDVRRREEHFALSK